MAFTICRSKIAPVMAKQEATANYGVDAAPTANTDDILTYDSAIVALPGSENFAFNPHSKSFTKTKDIIGQRWVDVTLNTAFQGSGAAGTLANGTTALAALMLSCGCKVTTNAGNNVIYQAQSNMAALQSATVWVNHNGFIHKMAGC